MSPLLKIEPAVAFTIIHMCCIRKCITPTKGLPLVNHTIEGTVTHTKLVKVKKNIFTSLTTLRILGWLVAHTEIGLWTENILRFIYRGEAVTIRLVQLDHLR